MFAGSPSMARRRDGLARHTGAGPLANDNERTRSPGSALPSDARAIVEPVPIATNKAAVDTAGGARASARTGVRRPIR